MTYLLPRISLAIAAMAVLTMLLAASPPPAHARDRDCADFATQRAAQIFFLKHGGPRRDPHRLDGDDDGVACEDNPCPCYRRKHLPRIAMRDFDFGSGMRPNSNGAPQSQSR
jgi:Excalibur calcium-binding domain